LIRLAAFWTWLWLGTSLAVLSSLGLDAGGEPNPFFVQVFKERNPLWSNRIIHNKLQNLNVFKQFSAVVSLWTSIGWDQSDQEEQELFRNYQNSFRLEVYSCWM